MLVDFPMNVFRSRAFRVLAGGLVSLVYPGFGQILARQWRLGAGLLAVSLVIAMTLGAVMRFLAPSAGALVGAALLWAAALVLGVGSALDAVRRLRKRTEDVRPPWPKSAWFALLVAVVVNVSAGAAMPRFWRSFSTPTSSNVPALQPGDYFMADLHAFVPKRGDMILFARGGDPQTIWVKRIVGLPGETVQLKAGRLYIDNQLVAREPIDKVRIEDRFGKLSEVPTYRETPPGGASYAIVEIEGDTGFNDDTQPFLAPPRAVFVMGDNRDNSTDSRAPLEQDGVGFVQYGHIVGKAATIFWSADSARILAPVK